MGITICRTTALLILSYFATGCSTFSGRSEVQPTSLKAIRNDIVSAGSTVDKDLNIARDIEAKGAGAHDGRTVMLIKELQSIKVDLVNVNRQLDAKQLEIDKATSEMNKVVTRLNYLEPKYSEAIGILWKWRLIAIGSWLAIGVYFAFRGWLKVQFPILGRFL